MELNKALEDVFTKAELIGGIKKYMTNYELANFVNYLFVEKTNLLLNMLAQSTEELRDVSKHIYSAKKEGKTNEYNVLCIRFLDIEKRISILDKKYVKTSKLWENIRI